MRRSSKSEHQWLRMSLGAGTASRQWDAELLHRFRSGSYSPAEDAFESLLLRHGPMVFSVCSRILGDRHDAEDAFQATFLILASRAESIREQGSVASWLHGVALRVASKLRDSTVRRRAEERRFAEMSGQRVDVEATRAEEDFRDHEALHQEVQKLPRQYREVIVLCYFQGMTQEAAANLLGCPSSTVGVRLMRARALLKARLTRRGISRPGGEILASLLFWYTEPEMPESLAASTRRLLNGNGRKLSAAAALIVKEILKGTVVVKRTRVATVVLAATLAIASLGGALAGVASWSHRTDPLPVVTKYPTQPLVMTQTSASGWDKDQRADSDQRFPNDSRDRYEPEVVAVPEPSTLAIAVTMVLIIGGYACLRRGTSKLPGSSPPGSLVFPPGEDRPLPGA